MATDDPSRTATAREGSGDGYGALGELEETLDPGPTDQSEADRLAAEWSVRHGEKIVPLRPDEDPETYGTAEASEAPVDPADKSADDPEEDPYPELFTGERLRELFLDDAPPIVPELLHRSDGRAILYRNASHILVGRQTSLKTWLALEALRRIVVAGGKVVIVDYESRRRLLAQRLQEIGLGPEHADRITFYEYPRGIDRTLELFEETERRFGGPADLVLFDAMAGALRSAGLSDSGEDVTRWHDELVASVLRSWGSCVITIDHIGHAETGRPKGPSEKLHRPEVVLLVELKDPAKPATAESAGSVGSAIVKIVQNKDRHGRIPVDPYERVAEITLSPRYEPTGSARGGPLSRAEIVLDPPGEQTFLDELEDPDRDERRDQIVAELAKLPTGGKLGVKKIRALVGGREERIAQDLRDLQLAGRIVPRANGGYSLPPRPGATVAEEPLDGLSESDSADR